ncbi:MAG: hypothetical protein KDA66_00855 [Planctomycetaceae bacterium]|nr:hypothetical protein [Planctomycetaceae bacterium]
MLIKKPAHEVRLVVLLAVFLFGGCGSIVHESPIPSEAFRYDSAGIIYLDTRVPPSQKMTFGMGLGSITLETVSVADGKLTFLYTPETEGGYTVYECVVPISEEPVTFKVAPDHSPGETSFDLQKCKVIRAGNLLWE